MAAQQKKGIWSLSDLGSAIGGAFFDDPSSSDEEDKQATPAVSNGPAPEAAATKSATPKGGAGAAPSSSSSNSSGSSSSSSGTSAGDSDGANSPVSEGGGATAAPTKRSGLFGAVSNAATMGIGAVGYVVPTFGMLSPKKDFAAPQKTPRPRRKGEIPVAGATCADFFRDGLTDEQHTWFPCDATTFQLRVGPNYEKLKKKGPSGDSLYELVGLE